MTESDDELLEKCRGGDQAAWRDLVARHTRRVFGVAYRFTGRLDQAEDLTQEVFVRVYQSLDRYQPADGNFPAWLQTVARNQAIDHYRRSREERRESGLDPEALAGFAAPDEGPLKSLERAERVSFVHRGLRSLPPALREALILRDLEGLPYEEIAGMLSLPVGTVKSRINRGRLELARRLLGRTGPLRGDS